MGAVLNLADAVFSEPALTPVPPPTTVVISLIVRPELVGIDKVNVIGVLAAVDTSINGLPPNVVALGNVTGMVGRLSRTSGPYSKSSLQEKLVTASDTSSSPFIIICFIRLQN
jgi:hypothetical protein